LSYGRISTRNTIGSKRIVGSATGFTMGDLNMNDQSVIDALNSGLTMDQVAQLQAQGTTDAQLEQMATASGIVSNENILTAQSLIPGIPNYWYLVAFIFLQEIATFNSPKKRSR
jgi:hypothetical protein